MRTWTSRTPEDEMHAPGAKGLQKQKEGKHILPGGEGTEDEEEILQGSLEVSGLSLVGQADLPQARERRIRALLAPRLEAAHVKAQRQTSARQAGSQYGDKVCVEAEGGLQKA